MNYYGIFAALVMAFLLTLIFSSGFKNKGPWGLLWVFFLIIFLAGWAGQLWINPIGPVIMGVAWVPVFFVALVFASLLAAAVSLPSKKDPVDQDMEKRIAVEQEENTAAVIGVFFWLLIVILIITIFIGYYMIPDAVIIHDTLPVSSR